MATTTNLGKVHVFPSEDSYNTNKGSVGANDLALVPIGTATTSEYGLTRLASESDVLGENGEAVVNVPLAYELNDFRRMNKAYTVSDKVNCAFRFEFYLECTTAGTTSAETLDTRNVTYGQVITDGTCQWTVRTHVKSVNGNVPDANGNIEVPTTDTAQIKQIVLNTFFPIGSIYMDATGNIDPNTQFGGTWAKIENRFLLASGSKGVGATGGEENVTLSTNQIPSHNHSGRGNIDITGEFWFDRTNGSQVTLDGASGAFYGTRWTSGYVKAAGNNGSGNTGMAFSAARNWSGSTPSAGGGQAHNNMPPYQVVNVWRRTA